MQTMMVDYFPRAHTAIAEWLACIVFMLPLKKRLLRWQQLALYVLSLGVLLLTNLVGERQESGPLWIALMGLGMLEMLLMIRVCCRVSWVEAGYYWAHAFIAAEFAASLEWQINYYLIAGNTVQTELQTYICMLAVFGAVYSVLYLLNRHILVARGRMHVTVKELVGVLSIALVAFFISNFNLAFQDNVFSESLGAGVLYSRTLVDFGGLVMLYAHDESRSEVNLRLELEAMESLLNRQYEQYRQFDINNKTLHRVYHDLKHQIDFIRNETNDEKRASYLAEMERAVSMHGAEVKTGHPVLDTFLTSKSLACLDSGISMTCFADAQQLDFMDVMDICSIFGNAIDNAVECVQKIEDPGKRLIKVSVYSQNRFIMIRIENYCETAVDLSEGLPATTKKDKQLHGYGVKSIMRAVEKYNGCVNIEQRERWFTVNALIPLLDKAS